MIFLGYGAVILFFLILIYVLEKSKKKEKTFSEYATAGRSFGSYYSTMAFVNTWLPGTVFTAFASLAASQGVIGFYLVTYSLCTVLLMFFLAKPVHMWGKIHDLRTQADLLGLRYNSKVVRIVAALIGVIASFPWIILGMQSLTLAFSYLSFGAISAEIAVYIGILVIVIRQIWTARLGARGLIIGDMVQGILAYIIGTLIILGILTWLLTNGHGFNEVKPSFYTLPSPGSPAGGLYFFSITITGALGAWCWPDIFVRLFTSKSTKTIQKSAVQASIVIYVFAFLLMLISLLASSMKEVEKSPGAVWFISAQQLGPIVLTIAGLCVIAATMGNVGANLQALGTQTANDIIGPIKRERISNPKIGVITVAVLTIAAALFAITTANNAAGASMITLALVSYQGIVQLAPTIFGGIFWRKANKYGAVGGMVAGFASASYLEFTNPVIPGTEGLTSGVIALIINTIIFVSCGLFIKQNDEESKRVNKLFDSLKTKNQEKTKIGKI